MSMIDKHLREVGAVEVYANRRCYVCGQIGVEIAIRYPDDLRVFHRRCAEQYLEDVMGEEEDDA